MSPYLDSPHRRRQAGLLAAAAPDELRGCFVPLLAGGAAAIALLQQHPEAWFGLSSPDADVVAVWESARDDVEGLLARIHALAEEHDRAHFAAVRDRAPEDLERMPAIDRAARFVYLRGTARPDAAGEPLSRFGAAAFGRDRVAFDAAGFRALAVLLRDRDVSLSVRGLFEVLPEVGEDDVVVLDLADGVATTRELRSFVAAVTAKGAGVLASDLGAGFYESWPGMVPLGAEGGGAVDTGSGGHPDDTIWVNTVLNRARAAGRAGREW